MAETINVFPRQLGFAFDAEEQSDTPMAQSKKTKKNTPKSTTRKTGKTAVKEKPGRSKSSSKTEVVTSKETKVIPRRTVQALSDDHIEAKAKEMAGAQREISVSEFFAKNRHLLGFDNPRKALLTAVKEAVDNSLDACEEAHILPDLEIAIKQLAEDRFVISVQDNGPGIIKNQIPNIFGRLLYGSKFHRLRMSRGQQGIGISAAGMYGLLTTGKPVKIVSKTGPRAQAHYYELRINTKVNRPEIIKDETIEWDAKSGTKVEIELEGRFQRGRQSVDEYLAQTAITNPHARIRYLAPDGQDTVYERADGNVVEVPKAIKPHPYGVELGVLMKMAKDTAAKTMTSFLTDEFSRVSDRVSQEILSKAKLSSRKNPHQITPAETEHLHRAINEIKIMAPSTDCIVPIGEEALHKSLQRVVEADFYKVITRPPSVYRGNPFQIEVALAYGGTTGDAEDGDEDDVFEKGKNGANGDEQQTMRVM
ncbi:MAG: DNA topoisomerase VI subunit B, partial [Sedimentisphaerales bacterium]|nr:DNA topoisomerase VI subunit B [Sedimentisphaerales bacterium]